MSWHIICLHKSSSLTSFSTAFFNLSAQTDTKTVNKVFKKISQALCLLRLWLIMLRQHCPLTICNELVELTNSETAAATPLGGGAKSLRSLSSLETGSVWSFLVN